MLNLYTDAIDPNGFMSLVSKNVNTTTKIFERENRKIITSFAIISLIVLSAISNGVQFQQNFEQERASKVISLTSAI